VSGNQNKNLNILKYIRPQTRLIFFKRSFQRDDSSTLEVLNYLTNKAFVLDMKKKDQLIFFNNFDKKMLLFSFADLDNFLNISNQDFIKNYSSQSQNETILLGEVSPQEGNYIKSVLGGKIIRIT